ncbi:MAG: CHASE2 domain-containing protein [Limisphaerales bacterium]
MRELLTRHTRWIIAASALVLFCFLQSAWFRESELWMKLEGSTIDRRYELRGASRAHPDIVIIGVESSSLSLDALWPEEIETSEALQYMQNPWPWDRRVYALVLEKLLAAEARVVMFDFVFRGPTEGDPDFAALLEKHQAKVTIGSMFQQSQGANDERHVTYLSPNENILTDPALPVVGFVNTWPDADGVTRKARFKTSLWNFKGLETPDGEEDLISLGALTAKKANHNLRVPAKTESAFINFAGRHGTYEIFPIEKLFVDKLWEAPPFNRGALFKDKIVVIGPIAEIFHDVHQTPFGAMAGPEVQANMLATLLENSFLRESAANTNRGITGGLIALAAMICIFLRNALLKGLLLGVTGVGFLVCSQLLFVHANLVIPVVPPLLGFVSTGIAGFGLLYFIEQLERKRVRSVLDKYVSRNVARTILNDPRSFVDSFRGRKQAVTVLFSDIRGFTSMTEGTDAERLVAQLNEYFLEMVAVVLKQGGTLQKFIGDAVMAVWGDTHSHGFEQDAKQAVSAALQMRAALEKLNSQWEKNPNRTQLSIGIGINHGEVVVGNIGHPQRMEFTVLGDGVNLAARLESATKQFRTDILIGQETEMLTRNDFVYRYVGAIAFKGKTHPVDVFMLLGDRSVPAPAWLQTYHDGVSLYRQRCFGPALAKLAEAQQQIGTEDYLCKMYIERSRQAMKADLPASWDGSFALTEK